MSDILSDQRADHLTLLKTLCLLGVIFVHAAMPFSEPTLFVKTYADTPSHLVTQILFWFDFMIIPAFMLASGYIMALTLDRKSRTFIQQALNRAKRLLLAWIAMMIFWMIPLYTWFDIPSYGRDAGFTLAQTARAGLLGLFADHLWFLLVLFWVSLFWLAALPLIKRFGIGGGLALAIAVALLIDIFGQGVVWYKLSQTAGPLVYFYLGYVLYQRREAVAGLIEKRPLTLLFGNAGLYIAAGCSLGYFGQFQNIFSRVAGCVGAFLAYQICVHLARAVYAPLRTYRVYCYFEDYAFRFYLFHMLPCLLIFRFLNSLKILPLIPFILLSLALTLAVTTIIVITINTLERKWRDLVGKNGCSTARSP